MKNKLIFILWLLMFSFFSCDFGIKENEETNSKEYFTVKGSCSIQGAIPSDLFPEKSIKQNAQRTVVPKIEIGKITVSFESETGDTKSAEVVNKDFEIELPPGKWTVKAQGKKSDDVIIESESCQIELPAENTNVKLVLKPTQSDTGKGTFKFSFGTNYDKVLGMKYTYKKHGATEPQSAIIVDFSDTINKELSSGVYTFRFDFYSDMDCEGELLYSFKEVVNIFDGLTTDTWIGAGEYIEDGKICITDTMISQFVSTTVYVSNDGNDSNLGTFFEPVKTIQNAVDKVIAMNVITASSEGNPYKILLLSDIYTPSNDSFENMVNIVPPSASDIPLYLTISKCGDKKATINANRTDTNTGRVMYIGENANVTLQNLILTGGYLNNDENNENEKGAGLCILNNDAIVKIENSEISGNEIDNGSGAGLHIGYQANMSLNLTIENSKISSNTINHKNAVGTYSGAGIAIENVAVTLTITNSEINSNKINQEEVNATTPEDKGVGLWLGNCATTIISGTDIKQNKIENAASTNENAGGGVYLKGGTLTIQNSTEKNTVISGNISGYGNGVYVGDGTFTMNDGAVISSDNDVYLANGTTITVTGNLTSTDTVATITPNVYNTTRQVLVAGSGVIFTDKIVNRFLVTPENSNEWYVTVNGKLQEMEKDDNGYLGREPSDQSKTTETVTTEQGNVVLKKVSCSIESYDNMLWIAHELKDSSIDKFDIRLTNDIEIPSGKWTSPLDVPKASTIDGQGHSIIFNGGSGLFDRFHGGSIENLVLEGTINTNSDKNHFSGQGGVGVLAGSAYKTTIKNVVSTVDVVDTGNGYVGGLIGYFGGNSDMDEYQPGSFIQNCAVYANIKSTKGTVGGLVGGTWSGTQCWQINNCIYKGNVTGGTDQGVGAIIGTHNTGRTSTFKDTWYCANTSEIVGKYNNQENGVNFDGYEGTVISKTDAEIASSQAATLLNTTSDGTQNDVWVYDSGSPYPTLEALSSE